MRIKSRPAVFALMTCLFLGVNTTASRAADTPPAPEPVASPNDVFSASMKAGREAVKAKTFGVAVREFEVAVKAKPNDANGHNMLAYSLRNLGDLKRAKVHYDEALRLDPKHLGAHEYIGDLYIKTNQMALAEKQLQILEQLCNKKCDEYTFLAEKIAEAKKPK
jgi:Flp pilus assembly protein TadD